MREQESCAVIQDLLPLYVDELTKEETNEIIRKHLEGCKECNDLYRCMSEEIGEEEGQTKEAEEMEIEIDYLKKIRRASTKKALFVAGAAALIVLTFTFIKLFVYGTPSKLYTSSLLVEGDTIQIQGVLQEANKVYSHYKVVEDNGEKQLVIYAAKKSLWNRDRSFEITYSLEKAKGLEVGSRKVTKSGEVVSMLAADIFAKKHSYVGDASKNGALTYAMGIGEELGSFTNELQTKKEPYGWTLQFQNLLEASNETIFNEKMRGYAYVLLATVDNVDEISWSYMVRTEEGIQQNTVTLTVLEADGLLGEEVKAFGKSEERIEELLIKVGLGPMGSEQSQLSPMGSEQSQLKEYRYRLTLTGRMPNAAQDSTFVVLTDRKDLTFEEVSKSLYSSNSNDWITDVVIVSME